MKSRALIRFALAGTMVGSIVCVAALGVPAWADDAAATAGPVVAACANPKLPPDILDGEVAPAAVSALPVVDASAPGLVLGLAVAADDESRELGLMCVTRLKPRHGMIFVFATSRQWDFWMKNTLVPLDMVWLLPDGTITTIAARVPASTRSTPDDAVARRSGLGKFVIELASGEAAADKLKVGERLTLPALRATQ